MADEGTNGVGRNVAPSLGATGGEGGDSINIDTGSNSVELHERRTNRKSEDTVAESRDLIPLEDGIAEESHVTIDTTDKENEGGDSINIDTGSNSVELHERRTNRKSEDTVAESRDLGPLEDGIAEESVVTVDATDKRHHRSATRARHTYAAKKTVAQGMMDVALITANANQLRYLVEYQRNSPTFFVNVFLIVVSLLLQIGVGVSLIFKGRFDIQGKGKSPQALKINNYVVVGVFLITIINVFVAAFSVSASPAPSALPNSA